ncbi:MAG: ABC transporter ATP-binding protein [Cohaesibacteraceae bacterium]|nr:ABC transporter ATP-binding protein [Cohaesibacteraceae bacterium]
MSLDIKNLCAGYGRTRVLKDITISNIKPGEFVGLIGPNASGKSTLFKTITGIVKPKSGAIRLNDMDLVGSSRRERAGKVAYMPQAFGCNASLTVFESVLLALKQTTGWRVQRENLTVVSKTLETLNLAHLADRGLSQLSGGQSQMVAVAQALVRKPGLLLLDEPTSALDLHHQLAILSSIKNATPLNNMIVIAALHDLNLAAQFCDRLILIRHGRVLADGTPSEVLSLEALGETYGVQTRLEQTQRGTLYVDARLSA